mgnify:CR=1 FL=1|tara:strand:- start:416 stop:655 length:240 start_codon:yes stop_codon:yes gene_type:complete
MFEEFPPPPKFTIGDIVTPDPEKAIRSSFLGTHIGEPALVEGYGLAGMFTIRWLDSDIKVTMPNDMFMLVDKAPGKKSS